MPSFYPLTRHSQLDAVICIDNGRKVTVAKFLRDISGLAAGLPSRRYLVNLCNDRYRFTVALGAALLRQQIIVLPPSDTDGVLRELIAEFDDLYCLHDDAAPAIGAPTLMYSEPITTSQTLTMPCLASNQPAVIFFTSGSTGRPTPHLRSWGCLVRSALSAGAALDISRIPGATIVGTVPQQHSYGFESTVMLALQHGLALHHARPFYPADIIATVEATPNPRILVTTPIHLRAMVADPGRLPPVDLLISATAPLMPELAAEAEHRFDAPLVEIYGCTEAGQLAVRRIKDRDLWRCLNGVVLRQDTAGTWASGTLDEGEVLLCDVLELAGPDSFRLFGRTADLVNVAGKRTSIAHLNYHLNSIPGVRDGVFIVPEVETHLAARLKAFVVAPTLSVDAILAALRQRIDPVFLPRPLVLVDTLPRNSIGKLTHHAVAGLSADDKH